MDSAVKKSLLVSMQKEGFKYRLLSATEKPWKFGFFSLMRHYAARHHALPPLGEARRPQHEAIRLGQLPSLTFAAREIANVDTLGEHPRVNLFGLGMLGPNGPLPIHFTEIAKERLDHRHDATLVNFLNIFHHRYFTHMYRAWSQAQATAGLDRIQDERFSRYIAWITGNDPEEITESNLPAHARLSASAHHVRESRNPDGLASTLSHYFGVHIQIKEHIMDWVGIEEEDYTLLSKPSIAAVLGEGALIGEKVPDRQNKFRIVIGPLSLSEYLRFTPNGKDLPLLVEWVRSFIGYELVWDIELKVKSNAAPPSIVGDDKQLGWSTWLGEGRATAAITGMIFEPEQYFNKAQVTA